MSQHDFDIANQGFAAFRADLNNALKALGSLSSGTAEPATTYANQLWYETDTNTLHIRNEANSAWLDLMVIDQTTGSPSFNAGNVGIGTTAPVSALHLASTAGPFITFQDNDAGANQPSIGTEGTAGSLIYSTGGTSASHIFKLNRGASEAVRIDSSGNVGIGTDTPEAPLHVVGGDVIIEEANDGGSTAPILIMRRTSTTPADNDYIGSITFQGVDDALADQTYARILAQATDVTAGTEDGALIFWTTGAGTSAERARIGSDGVMTLGQTSNINVFSGVADGCSIEGDGAISLSRNQNASLYIRRRSNNGAVAAFLRDTTQVGRIDVTTTATSYVTSSDYRLKENVQPIVDAISRLMDLKPVNFAWKVDGSRVDGFLAHEVQSVVPEAISGEKDAVDADGNPEYQGIDQSKLVPLLTAALQEVLTEIASMKARITALEAN